MFDALATLRLNESIKYFLNVCLFYRGEGKSLIVELFDTDGEELNVGNRLIELGEAKATQLEARPSRAGKSEDVYLPG